MHDADVLVEATVSLDGKPLVDVSHPDVFVDHGQMTLRPCEARTFARALLRMADVADKKVGRK